MEFDAIPNAWWEERFTVVAAGNGEFAFHNALANRFLRLEGDKVNGGAEVRNAHALPTDWHSQRFVVVDAGGGRIALHNRAHNQFVRLCGGEIDAKGGPKAVPYESEHFQVKLCSRENDLCLTRSEGAGGRGGRAHEMAVSSRVYVCVCVCVCNGRVRCSMSPRVAL